MQRAGVDIRPEAMGVTWDDATEAIRTLPTYVREAGLWYTVADARPVTDAHAERVRDLVETGYGPWRPQPAEDRP